MWAFHKLLYNGRGADISGPPFQAGVGRGFSGFFFSQVSRSLQWIGLSFISGFPGSKPTLIDNCLQRSRPRAQELAQGLRMIDSFALQRGSILRPCSHCGAGQLVPETISDDSELGWNHRAQGMGKGGHAEKGLLVDTALCRPPRSWLHYCIPWGLSPLRNGFFSKVISYLIFKSKSAFGWKNTPLFLKKPQDKQNAKFNLE